MPARAMLCLLILFAQSGSPVAGPQQPPVTNASVIRMVASGLGDAIIITAIRNASATSFDLTAEGLIALKQAGVSNAIIEAMQEPSSTPILGSSPHDVRITNSSLAAIPPISALGSGIFVEAAHEDRKALVPLEPTVFSQAKSGGVLASMLTYGIKKAKWKAVIRSPRAMLRLSDGQPVFYFQFESPSPGLADSRGFAGWMAGASSPNEFVLARMAANTKERALVIGEFGAYGASAGTRSEDTVEFTTERLRPGLYRVVPSKPMFVGEYCFFYAAGVTVFGPSTVGKLFDFGIDRHP